MQLQNREKAVWVEDWGIGAVALGSVHFLCDISFIRGGVH